MKSQMILSLANLSHWKLKVKLRALHCGMQYSVQCTNSVANTCILCFHTDYILPQ